MKMKKYLAVLLVACMSIGLAACGSKEAQKTVTEIEVQESVQEPETQEPEVQDETEKAVEEKGVLTMATTTSTEDTGLLDYLAPLFLEDTGWKLEWTAVGTGEALKMGENGDVDVVLVHAKASEEEFVANGYGVERFPVMYNDFVIIGPEEEDAYNGDLETCLKTIAEENRPFVSRGDDSGTHKKELKLWEAFGIDSKANPNYIESGQGMGATITMADEQQAYSMTDRGTWLKFKSDADLEIGLNIVCQGEKNLLNQYGVIAVNPEKYPELNNEGANAFIEWICSDDSSVYENLIYPLKLRGITPNKERIDQMLERTGMAAQKNQYARSLSSGERQKLSFLRAIIFCPKFVMMDETLSNLDQENEESIISYIREIQEISPITWLIVSHQLDRKIDLFDVSHQMERGVYLGIVES